MAATYVPSQLSELSGSITTASVSDFAEGVDDRLNALLIAGTGITKTYDDTAGTLTIAATGGGGGPVGPTLDLNTTAGATGTINATSHATKGELHFNGGSVMILADGSLYSKGPVFSHATPAGSQFIVRTSGVCDIEVRPKDNTIWAGFAFYDATTGLARYGMLADPAASGTWYFSVIDAKFWFRINATVVVEISTAETMKVMPRAATSIGGVVKGFASQSANLQEWRDSSDAVLSTVSENGYWTTRKTSAPADGELVAGEAAFWLDATNGAAKFMIKAKQADGTVRSGSITLS